MHSRLQFEWSTMAEADDDIRVPWHMSTMEQERNCTGV